MLSASSNKTFPSISSRIVSQSSLKAGSFSKQNGRNVLFNDALNTFCLRLYGVRHMVKDHSDSERGNKLLPHGLFFQINCNSYFICIIHRQDNTYHGLCYTSRGALAGTRISSMDPSHHERTLLPRSWYPDI